MRILLLLLLVGCNEFDPRPDFNFNDCEKNGVSNSSYLCQEPCDKNGNCQRWQCNEIW